MTTYHGERHTIELTDPNDPDFKLWSGIRIGDWVTDPTQARMFYRKNDATARLNIIKTMPTKFGWRQRALRDKTLEARVVILSINVTIKEVTNV